ncbi:hypothetical protein [Nocardia nova]|nr:hypothetical protein [Nocardia nova]
MTTPQPVVPPQPDASLCADIADLVAQSWSREADDFGKDPHLNHRFLALLRIRSWLAAGCQQQPLSDPTPHVAVDRASLTAILTIEPVEFPAEPHGPTALVDTIPRILNLIVWAQNHMDIAPFEFVPAVVPAVPAFLRCAYTPRDAGPSERLLSVRVATSSGLVLATVCYETDNDLLCSSRDDALRKIHTIEDLVTAVIADIDNALAKVWSALHELPR